MQAQDVSDTGLPQPRPGTMRFESMRRVIRYTWKTDHGTIAITMREDGKWHIYRQDQDLGNFDSAQQACEWLCTATTDSFVAHCAYPLRIEDWNVVP